MKKNVLDNMTMIMFPLSTFVLCLLANFVRIGFKMPDENFWLDTALTTLMQMTFFLSFKSIFKKQRQNDTSVIEAEKLYQLQYNAYLDEGLHDKLVVYTQKEQTERIDTFIREHLLRAGVTQEEFEKKYKFNPFAVLSTKLPLYVKSEIWKCRKWRKIQKVEINELLPNIKSRTVFRVLTKNDEDVEKQLTLQRFLTGIAIALGFASIFVTTDFSGDVLASVISLTIKFVVSFWQIFMAKMTAEMLKRIHVENLASKAAYFDDFFGAVEFNFSDYVGKK